MKKGNLMKILSFIMAICFMLPLSFMLVGCDTNKKGQQEVQQEEPQIAKYYLSELKNKYSTIEQKLDSLLHWMEQFENNRVMDNDVMSNRYIVFNYGWWANAGGGYSSYTMYMSRYNTYIVYASGLDEGKPYCKIVGDELFVPNYESGNLKYEKSNYNIEDAISNGFDILQSQNIREYKERIENCEYLEYKGYLHNLKTGEYFEVSENKDTNIIFYKTFSDYITNDAFSWWYADNLTSRKHVYLNDNTAYSDFSDVQFSYSTIHKSELPLTILEIDN